MAESKNSAYREDGEKNPFVVFFTNLFAAIKLPFPPKKNGAKSEPAIDATQVEKPVEIKPSVVEDEINPPNVVTLPRQSFVPLKLEAEADEGERSTNPLLLWQVYAIGGILVLRWAWTRWNERKGQKKPKDEPPPARD